MKWLSYILAAILAITVTVSLVGIVADSARLDLWTQLLMWCMLGTVVLVPVAVYASTRSTKTRSSDSAERSPLRVAAYAFSVIAIVWTAISMISLFVDPERLAFWTQSVLWSLLILVVWAPIMAFFVNPFEEPIRPSTKRANLGKHTPDFVDHEAPALPPASAPAMKQPDSDNSTSKTSTPKSPSVEADLNTSDSDDRGWPYV